MTGCWAGPSSKGADLAPADRICPAKLTATHPLHTDPTATTSPAFCPRPVADDISFLALFACSLFVLSTLATINLLSRDQIMTY